MGRYDASPKMIAETESSREDSDIEQIAFEFVMPN
jgi:hypothetical protein